MMVTSAVILNLRDIVHGGFKEVGEKPLRLFMAHIVHEGKLLSAPPGAAK